MIFSKNWSKYGPIDPVVVCSVMKKFVGPDIPHVHLDVSYEQGVDLHIKQEEARDKFPIEITTNKWGDGVIFSGLMGIRHIEKVCADPQIVKVTGTATPRHN